MKAWSRVGNYLRGLELRGLLRVALALAMLNPLPFGVGVIPARAQSVPSLMSFQGRLTDSLNNPLTGPHNFIFEIYDDPAAGTQLWTETQNNVPVANGVFSVQLGSVNPLTPAVFTNGAAYLQITVGGDLLTPRERLVTSPYAFGARMLDGRQYSAFVSTDATAQTIIGPKTFSGAVAVPTPTLGGHAANKDYVDAQVGGGGAWTRNAPVVKLTSAGDNIVIQSTLTVQGDAFSVGGAAFGVAGGDVGIGTSSPGGRLHISGGGGSGGYGLYATASGNAAVYGLSTGGGVAGLLAESSAGSGYGLRVLGNNITSGNPILVEASGLNGSDLILGTVQNDNAGATRLLRLRSGSTLADRFVVESSGKVGIGTAFPAEMLHVSSGSAVVDFGIRTSTLTFAAGLTGDPSTAASGMLYYNASSSKLRLFNGAWVELATGTIPSGGNFVSRAGDSMTGQLTVRGASADVSSITALGAVGIGGVGLSGGTLVVKSTSTEPANPVVAVRANDGTELMRVQPDGKVGIGVSSPGYALDVRSVAAAQTLNVTSNEPADSGTGINISGHMTNGIYLNNTAGNGQGIYVAAKASGVRADMQAANGVAFTAFVGIAGGTGLNISPSANGTDTTGVSMSALGAGNGSSRPFLSYTQDNNAMSGDVLAADVTSAGNGSFTGNYINMLRQGSSVLRVNQYGAVGLSTGLPVNLLDVNGGTMFRSSSTWAGISAPPNAASGQGALYFDGTKFKVSENGGGYADLVSGASGWTKGGGVVRLADPNDNALVQSTLTVQGNAFSVGGSTLAVKDGMVGVGTTTPATKLHILQDAAGDGGIGLILDRPDNASYQTAANWSTNGVKKWFLGMDNNSADDLGLYKWDGVGAGWNMTFKDGNVGLGTTAPASKLHIWQNTIGDGTGIGLNLDRPDNAAYETGVNWSTNGVKKWALGLENNSTDDLRLYKWDGVGAGWIMTFKDANVGIGTTSPARKVHMSSGTLLIDGDAATAFQVGTSSFIISSDGKVGIGTTNSSPASKLTVKNGPGLDLSLMGPVSSNGNTISSHNDDYTANIPLELRASVFQFTIGKVGIGTTNPGYLLDAQGGLINASDGLCIAGSCRGSWPSGIDVWTRSGANTMLTNADDHVGIGTTEPAERLHVAGNVLSDYGVKAGTVTHAPQALAPATAAEGMVYYNDADNKLKLYNGASWEEVASSAGGFVSKTGDSMTGQLTIRGASADVSSITALGAVGIGGAGLSGGTLVVKSTSTEPAHPVVTVQSNSGAVLMRVMQNGAAGAADVTGNYRINASTVLAVLPGTGNLGVGVGAGRVNSTGGDNTYVGYQAGYSNAAGYDSTMVGYQAGLNTTAGNNTFLGSQAGYTNVGGGYNTFLGLNAGYYNSSGANNTFVGWEAGYQNGTGGNNTAIGLSAGQANNASGNVFIGYQAFYTYATGGGNVVVGNQAGFNTGGSNNVYLGNAAGYNAGATASNNVFIGNSAGYNETGNNKLYIDNSNTAAPLVWGDFSTDVVNVNGRLGIGTTSPQEKLHVSSGSAVVDYGIRTSTLTFAAGLTGDPAPASGMLYYNATDAKLRLYNGAWVDLATGTIPSGGNFVGRAGDSMNGQLTMWNSTITIAGEQGNAFSVGVSTLAVKDGRVGIGISSPAQRLDVAGAAKIDPGVNGAGLELYGDFNSRGTAVNFRSQNGAIQASLGTDSNNTNLNLAVSNNGVFGFNAMSGSASAIFGTSIAGVGLGATPLSRLDVNGGVAVGAYAGANAAPASGLIVSGRVGIGTTSPQERLHVSSGSAVVDFGIRTSTLTFAAGLTGDPAAAANGMLYYNASTAKLRLYDGAWKDIATGGSSGWTDDGSIVKLSDPNDNAVVQSTLTVQGNAFSVGGSTLTVVDGKVGIGTTEAAGRLEVVSDQSAGTNQVVARYRLASGGTAVDIVNNDGSGKTAVITKSVWGSTVNSADSLVLGGTDNNSGSHRIDVNRDYTDIGRNDGATSFARFDNSGKLGVGTTSPQEKLHVSSGNAVVDFGIRTSTLVFAAGLAGDPVTAANGMLYYNASTAKLRLYDGAWRDLATGSAGDYVAKIGDSMTGQLTLRGASVEVSSITTLGAVGIGGIGLSAGTLVVKSTSTDPTNPVVNVQANNGTEVMRVQQDGNVGIGSTNFAVGGLTARLRVGGGPVILDNSQYLAWANAAGNNNVPAVAIDSSDKLLLRNGGGGIGFFSADATERMLLTDSQLTVKSLASGVAFQGSDTTTDVLISPDGKVGIGTTGPQEKLHVSSGSAVVDFGIRTSTLTFAAGLIADPTPRDGMVYYNANDDKLKLYAGSSWVEIATGAIPSGGNYVAKTGDSMTGQLTLAGSTLTVTGNAFSVGGSTLAAVDGNVRIGQNLDLAGDAATLRFGATNDTILARDAANTLAQRNGTNPQELRVYRTLSGADYQYMALDFNPGDTAMRMRSVGIVGGVSAVLPLEMQGPGTSWIYMADGDIRFTGGNPGTMRLTSNGFWPSDGATMDLGLSSPDHAFRDLYLQNSVNFRAAGQVSTTDLTLQRGGAGILEFDSGGDRTFRVAAAAAAAVGKNLTLEGGAAGAGAGDRDGGAVTLQGGAPANSGNRGALLLQNAGGNVGIGTGSPGQKVHMSSGTVLIDGDASTAFRVGVSSFIVNSEARVGIGTSNPAQTLEAKGAARFGDLASLVNADTVQIGDRSSAATNNSTARLTFWGTDYYHGHLSYYPNHTAAGPAGINAPALFYLTATGAAYNDSKANLAVNGALFLAPGTKNTTIMNLGDRTDVTGYGATDDTGRIFFSGANVRHAYVVYRPKAATPRFYMTGHDSAFDDAKVDFQVNGKGFLDGARLAPAALPGSPGAGDLYIDSGDSNKLKWHNGAGWQTPAVGSDYVAKTGDFMTGQLTVRGASVGVSSITALGAVGVGGVGLSNGTLVVRSTSTDNTNPVVNIQSQGGAELMRVQQDGKVGIGVTNPSATLEVATGGTALLIKNTADVVPLKIQEDHAAVVGYNFLEGYRNGEGSPVFAITRNGAANLGSYSFNSSAGYAIASAADMPFIAGSEGEIKFYGSNGGSVTIPPASSVRSGVVLGNTSITGGSANGTFLGSNPPAFSGNFVDFQVGGSRRFVVQSDGTLGIGAANPAQKVHMSSGTMLIDGDAPTAFKIGVSSFIVNSEGRVGVGLTNPAEKLEVSGNIRLTTGGNSLIVPTNNTVLGFAQSESGAWPGANTGWQFKAASGVVRKLYFYNSSLASGLDLQVDGALGVGTPNPAAKVHMSSGTMLIDGDASTAFKVGVSSFIVNSEGNIGVGTTAPSVGYRLDISSPGASGIRISDSANTSSLRFEWDNAVSTITAAKNGSSGTGINFRTQLANGNLTDTLALSAGSVGVGTLTPKSALDLSGGVLTFGSVSSSSTIRQDLASDDLIIANHRNASDSDIIFRTMGPNSADTKMVIEGGGDVGIGITNPSSKFEVSHDGNNAAYIHTSGTSGSEIQILELRFSGVNNPGENYEWIRFVDDDAELGRIEGTGAGGVTYGTTGGDFAEWLPQRDASEGLEPGDIVAVKDGRISRDTRSAASFLVVSQAPGFLGNSTKNSSGARAGKNVALVGQVPVKVKGRVRQGDYILPSGDNDGIGIAKAKREVSFEEFKASVVGVAWEDSSAEGIKTVNVAVGIK